MNIYILSLFTLFLISFSANIKQANILFRHGARNQIIDNYNLNVSQEEFGELTSVGIHQHYLFGSWLRERYVHNLSLIQQYDPTKILVRSTNYNRTIMSVQSNLLGLFPLGTGPILPDLSNELIVPPNQIKHIPSTKNSTPALFQPVPIHTKDVAHDQILYGYGPVCPRAAQDEQGNVKSQDFMNVENQSIVQRQELAKLLDVEFVSLNDAMFYQDTFISAKFNGHAYPNISEGLERDLEYLFSLQMTIYNFRLRSQVNLYSTPFFNDLLQHMESIINNESNLSLIINSAHDTNVLMILNAMNLTSWQCMQQAWLNQSISLPNCIYTYPGFASSVIFELWEDNGKHYVKLMNNGTYMPICESQQCDYEIFKSRILNQISLNYNLDCQINGIKKFNLVINKNENLAYLISSILIIGILFTLARCYIRKFQQKQQQGGMNELREVDIETK